MSVSARLSRTIFRGAFGLGLSLFLGLSAPASATQTINLTVVSGYAPTAAWVRVFQQYFVPELNKKLAATGNYKVVWNEGFSGTIAKPAGELEAVETGIADVGIVQTVFHPDKLLVYNIAYVTPFVSSDIDLITRTVNRLTQQFPAMGAVWGKHNQVFLTTLAAVDNYQIIMRRKIDGLASFKGLKIGGAGANLRYIEGIGATGVSTNLAELYNLLSSGIADGAFIWAEAAANFKLYEVAPFYVVADFGGVNSMALTVNKNTWGRLPEEVRKALQEVAEGYRHELAKVAMSAAVDSVKRFQERGGTLIRISAEDRQKWANSLPNIAAQWADTLKKQGYPSEEILSAYMDAMRKQGGQIARQWDKK